MARASINFIVDSRPNASSNHHELNYKIVDLFNSYRSVYRHVNFNQKLGPFEAVKVGSRLLGWSETFQVSSEILCLFIVWQETPDPAPCPLWTI